jgi:RHS repeat-associated protein
MSTHFCPTYDSLGRNSGGWVCAGSSQPTCTGGTLQAYGYTVQTVGTQVKQTCDIVVNVCNSFGYDEFNRLTARTVNQGTVQNFTYTYDRYGNRWAQNAPQGGPALSISFNQGNNIISSSGFSNDVVGNIGNDTLHGYSYDADGNLISVDNGQTATYYYDSLNQRVRIAPTRGTFEFVWDVLGRRVSTWAASNHSVIESNVYTDSAPLANRGGGQTQFEHQNWLGTERVRTTYNGTVAMSINSLPWADGHTPSGDNGDQHDFALMDRDLEDNTEHAQYRQYSTNLGRWQSPDLYSGSYDFTNPQSFNRYTYALNNPSSLIDPLGLFTLNPTPPPIISPLPPPNTPPAGCVSWGTQGCITATCANSGLNCPTGYPYAIQPTGRPYIARLSNAPNNGNPWYKNPCIQSALAKGAASTAIDAVGLLPEGGAVAGAFSLWHGAAGVSNGINILARVQFGAAIISTASAGSDASGDGAYSLAGAQLATGFASIGVGLAKAAPIVGQVISGISVAEDLYGTYKAVAGCHP